MADAYLRRPTAPPRWVILAGEGGERVGRVRRGLQRAAAGIGVPLLSVDVRREGIDLELGRDLQPPVLLYHHGEVDESQLSRLTPPGAEGPDLLLWTLPEGEKIRMRSLYLLSMWSWALRPQHLRCLWPCVDEGEVATAQLARVQASLQSGLHHAGEARAAELLPLARSTHPQRRDLLFRQLLQSVMAAPRAARRGAGAALAFALLLGFAWMGEARAQDGPREENAAVVTIELTGVKEGATEGVDTNPGGTWLVGRAFSLHLRPGAGVWNEDTTVLTLQTRREELYARLDGSEVALDGLPRTVTRSLVLSSPEFRLVMRQGGVRWTEGAIRLEPRIEGPMLPGKQGLLLTAGLAVVILFLFLRASSVRRRLDRPRERIRHGARSARDSGT